LLAQLYLNRIKTVLINLTFYLTRYNDGKIIGKKMNGIKALKISIVVVILVALTYFIVDTFLYGDKQTKVNYQNFARKVAHVSKKSTEGTDKSMVPIDGVTITLNGGKYHYMKADMSFKMKNSDDKKALEKNIDDVRDLMLRYTSRENGNLLATDKGKEAYKEKLKEIIYQTFGYKIEDIYFRNFVLAP